MSIALDVGTGRLKSLRCRNSRLVAQSVASVYSVVPDTDAHRRVLAQLRVPFATCDEDLVLMGDAAAEHAALFQVPCAPLLPEGRLPASDPPARQILSVMIEALLPLPAERGEVCGMSLPGSWQTQSGNTPEHEFLTRLATLRGYQTTTVGSATAVVLAEAAARSFTGIGVSIGAGTSELSVVHRGRELVCCSIPQGGDWIDQQLARNSEQYVWDARGRQYLATDSIARWKAELSGSLAQPACPREEQLAHVAHELVAHLLTESACVISQVPAARAIPQPLCLILTGATTQLPGFEALFRQALAEIPLPVAIDEVRIAADAEYTVARGCLISAELEKQAA